MSLEVLSLILEYCLCGYFACKSCMTYGLSARLLSGLKKILLLLVLQILQEVLLPALISRDKETEADKPTASRNHF